MKAGEYLGLISGYALGLITGSISFLRDARIFHPSGRLVRCRLSYESIPLPPFAMLRFSSATWKRAELPDVLGVALRMSFFEKFSEEPQRDDQDLLFVSFPHPWQTPFGPVLTNHKDYLKNAYYTVCPFIYKGQKVTFRLRPEVHGKTDKQTRQKILSRHIENKAQLILEIKDKENDWKKMGSITLEEELFLDQGLLKFNPFLNGIGIVPVGFIQHLRIGSYRLSQLGRSFRSDLKARFILARITKCKLIQKNHVETQKIIRH